MSYFNFYDGTDTIGGYNIDVNASIDVGLKDQLLTNSFSVFPNPAKDKINLNLDNLNNEHCSIEIFDLKGQSVLNKQLGNSAKVNEMVDLSLLEKGNYILKTRLGTRSQSTKLIVE